MDRSLATLLRSLQTSQSTDDAARLLPSVTGLLSRLSNPLNVTLLASQVLTNDLLYLRPVSLSACRSVFSVFYTAALRFAEDEKNEKQQFTRSTLSHVEWTRAVITGADNNSPRWRHLLLLGGTLLGFDGQGQQQLPNDLRHKIEGAIITASNLALQSKDDSEANSQLCVVFVLNTVFPLLADHHRAQIQYDLLLPELIESTYFSREGLEHGYWLGAIDTDVKQISQTRFHWDARSPSAMRLQSIKSRVLVGSLGPLSRLVAHSVENVRDSSLVAAVLLRLAEFSRNVVLSWRQNKLSEVEVSEEAEFLDNQTRQTVMPELLQLLRNIMFSIVICLRATTGRILLDATLSSDMKAPTLAIQTLHVLRDLYFVSHRFGQHSSSQYMFVYYTAIDILNQFPAQAESFFTSIKSAELGKIPAHPLDRLNDLFFLNTTEHFTLSLSPHAVRHLLIETSLPYVSSPGDRRLNELYEASHSVLLAIFAAPQNGSVAAQYIPFYIDTLLESFPASLTSRQFRLAVKSLMQVSAPHTAITAAVPQLQEVVLDMLRSRLITASEKYLLPSDPALTETAPLSEKSVFLLAIIENLSFLPVQLLEEWLAITAELLRTLSDPAQRNECQKRFWDVLSSGEMDVQRAAVCVAWWSSLGGRELVLQGDQMPEQIYEMSGAVQQVDSKI